MANVNLGERFEAFIQEQIRGGRYQNASEVVRASRMDRHTLAKDEVEKAKVHIGEEVVVRSVQGVEPAAFFGPGVGGVQDAELYPMALLPNQYQAHLAVYVSLPHSLVVHGLTVGFSF